MIKRPRQIDFFRPLTRINTWEEFNSFDNDAVPQGGNIPISQSENRQQTATSTEPTPGVAGIEKSEKDISKKVEIPIILAQINNKPSAATAQAQNNGKQIGEDSMKKRKLMQSSYIRFKPDDVWPQQDKYELADDDLFFLKDFNEQHGFSMQEKELEALIEAFEMRSGRDFISTWIDMKDHILYDVRDKYTFNNLEKIYNYWRVKRDTIKRPLLRLHWKPNFNDKDPHVAFRPRVAEKMKLRRQTKQNDDEQYLKLGILREEMQKCKLLIEQMRLREDIKEWQYETNSLQFVSELYKTDRSLSYMFADEYFENIKDVDSKKSKLDERFNQIMGKSNTLKQELGKFIEQPVEVTQLQQQQTGTKQSSRLEGQKKQSQLGAAGGNNREETGNSGLNHRASSSALLKRTIDESLASGSSNNNNTNNNSLAGSVAAAAAAQNGESDDEKSGMKKLTKQERKEKKLQLKHQKQISKLQASSQATPLAETVSSQQLKEETKKESANVSQSTSEKTNKDLIQINLKNAANNNINSSTNTNKNQEGGINTNNKLNQDKDGNVLSSTDADLVGYLVWVLIEGGKRDLSIDKVLNLNNNQIDSETALNAYSHNAHLLNQATQKHNSARNHLQQAGGVPGSSQIPGQMLSQSQQLFSQSSSSQQQQQQLLNSQQQGSLSQNPYSQSLHSNQFSNSNIPINGASSRISQSQQQQLPQQFQLQSQYQQQQQEMAALREQQKKKNLIYFKTRLRLGRSGLCNIDRLFDEKDNLRYEDLCSKEANYNPTKIAEKQIRLKTDQEKQSQNKLKVLSYSSNSTDLYKKEYFQAISKKYKRLADDNINNNLSEDTTEPLTPQASSDDLPVNQNLLEIENKNLKKIISQGLKEFQKRKLTQGLAGMGSGSQQQQGLSLVGSGQTSGGIQIQQQMIQNSQQEQESQQVTQGNQQNQEESSKAMNGREDLEKNPILEEKELQTKQTEQEVVSIEGQFNQEKDIENINNNGNDNRLNDNKQEYIQHGLEQLVEQQQEDQVQQNQELKQENEENYLQEELQIEEDQLANQSSFKQEEQEQFPIESVQNQESEQDQQQNKESSNLDE